MHDFGAQGKKEKLKCEKQKLLGRSITRTAPDWWLAFQKALSDTRMQAKLYIQN